MQPWCKMKLLTKKELLEKAEIKRNRQIEDEWFYAILVVFDRIIEWITDSIDKQRINTVLEELQHILLSEHSAMRKPGAVDIRFEIYDDKPWHTWAYVYDKQIITRLVELGYSVNVYRRSGDRMYLDIE